MNNPDFEINLNYSSVENQTSTFEIENAPTEFEIELNGGARGLKGDKGDTGSQGPQGPKGDKGDTGEQGIQGEQGIAGQDGYSPTVTTSKSGKTTTITITDVNGVHTATIQDGQDGTGVGDMTKAVYDTNDNGIVDNAELANNHTVLDDVPSNLNDTLEVVTGSSKDTKTITESDKITNAISISDLQLQGNTYQQTYTGKNLFNKSVRPSSQNGTSTTELSTGIRATITTAGQNKYTAITLPNPSNLLGKTLTLSANISISGKNSALIRFYWLNGTVLTGLIANTISATGSTQFTIPNSFPTNTNGIAIVFSSNAGSSTSQVGNYVDYTNVQLEVGSTQTSYEPYVGGTASPNPDYPQPIENVTGRQTIDVVGKNLFDKNNANVINGYIQASSSKIKTSDGDRVIYIPCQPNTIYTISKAVGTTENRNRFRIGDTPNIPKLETQVNNFVWSITMDNYSNYSYTTSSTARYLVIYIWTTGSNLTWQQMLDSIQIEAGSTATSYEPYKGNTYEINLGKNLVQSKEINSTTSNYATVLFVEADLKPNTTYTISYDGTPNNKLYTNENLFEQVTFTNISGRTKVTTTTKSTISKSNTNQYESGKGWKILKNGTSGAVGGANVFNDLQLETGSQATSYSPYFTPIELNKIGNYQDSIKKSTGKNLFDISTTPFITRVAYNSSGVQQDWDNYSGTTTKTKVQPNTTYTLSENRNAYTTQIVEYDSTGTFITRQLLSNYGKTFTTGNNTYLINISISDETIPTLVQLEKGSTITSYEPYLQIDTWYIEKKIGKYIFDGSTNAFGYSSSNSVFVTDTLATLIKKNTTMIANYYNQVDNITTYANMTTGQMKLDGTNSGRIIIKDTRYTSANDYKIWLQSNNLILYYILNTPTYTEITNTDLINQLESIELLNGINNIMVSSGDLVGILKLDYYILSLDGRYEYLNEIKANKTDIPTKTSQLTNDSGFITNSVNNLTNYTKTSDLSSVATSGSYSDLSNKPTMPVILSGTSDPTSDLGNDGDIYLQYNS